MADDILVAGLDISGFSPEKKRNLQEFIALFQKLETYHGKVYSPLSGSGLGEFNASAQQTNILLEQINFKLATLNSNVGTSFAAASSGVKRFKSDIDSSNSSIEEMGVKFTKMYGWLRRIAYILPGIGIAGIFNAAFTAIGDVADALGLTNNRLTENEKINAKINEDLTKQINLYDELYKQRKKLADIEDKGRYSFDKAKTDIEKSGGLAKDISMQKELNDLKTRYAESQFRTGGDAGAVAISNQIKSRTVEINDLSDAIGDLQHLVDAKDERGIGQKIKDLFNQHKVVGGVKQPNSEKENDATAKDLLSRLELLKKQNQDDIDILEEYYTSKNELDKKQNELTKFELDENRKQFVANEIAKYNETIEINKAIVKDKLSSDQDIINSEKNIAKARQGIVAANLFNITDDRDVNGKRSKTPQEISIATKSAQEQNLSIILEIKQKLLDITEEFYQRDLKATTETEKNKLDAIAISNERIYQNTDKSLQERIEAYKAYVKAKNDIADIEEKRDLDVLGLSKPQKTEISSNADKQRSNNSANSEKILYDIVYSDSQAKLKAIIDGNKLQDEENRKQYSIELNELNKSFAAKDISYRSFIGKTRDLQQKYKVDEEKENILNDSQELSRLNTLLKEQQEARDKYTETANSEKDPKKKKDILSQYDAEVKAISDTNKEKGIVEAKLGKESLDYANAMRVKELNGQKLLEENKRKIQEESFKLGKQLIDQQAEYRIRKIELQKEAQDSLYDSERDAVQKSSLDAINKTALDIQLGEQKREYDANVAKEEKKIKHDQAVADKKLAIAESEINTLQAITKTIAEYGGTPVGFALAASVGVLGELQTAAIALTDIPEYEHGTQGAPHQGGLARVGEKGKLEKIKEPGKNPYFVNTDQIIDLPVGTEVFPINDTPQFSVSTTNDSLEHTMMIISAIKKQKKEIKNIIKPVVSINMGWETYKNRIFNG